MKFTPEQLTHWRKYKKVQDSAEFNMFDQRAQRKTGLTDDQYTFVMDNYVALQAAALQDGQA